LAIIYEMESMGANCMIGIRSCHFLTDIFSSNV
jgi:hypothetical protein